MHELALLLKSYSADLPYAERLIESFHRFNEEQLPMFVVVPAADMEAFEAFASETVTVLCEDDLGAHLVTESVGGMRAGYINQEIVKLAFWELGHVENYFCVDSDAMFIRPIRRSDFIAPDGHPYTVLVEDNELKVEPRYHREHWISREKALQRIQAEVGLDSPVVLTCHGHQVFSSKVLRSFVEQFLRPRGWDYRDALDIAPYEFSWYNFWLQMTDTIPIHAREPLVKVFHHEGQHFEYILRGVTTDDIARGYLALVINSNYSRDLGLLDIDASKPVALSPYLSYGEVGQLVSAKIRDTLRRRIHR